MSELINGKVLARDVKENIRKNIIVNKLSLKLATIIVGNNSASHLYVKMKSRACKEVGVENEIFNFPPWASEDVVLSKVSELNDDDQVSGILIQLPLPNNFNTRKILDSINESKDVDGLTSRNLGKLMASSDCFISATCKSIMFLLNTVKSDLRGLDVVIINHSPLIGRPLSQMLLDLGATITICHEFTRNLKEKIMVADVVISAVGKRNIITADMVKEKSIVIDAGVEVIDGKVYGDVDFERVKDKVLFITPVPGGVGPMTIAMLLENIINKK